MIARIWRGWVRQEDSDAYVRYLRATGMAEYSATPGNVAATLLRRDLPDGRTEVVTISYWESMEAIRRFASEDTAAAVFYPEDDRFLVDRETTVTHWDVPLRAGID